MKLSFKRLMAVLVLATVSFSGVKADGPVAKEFDAAKAEAKAKKDDLYVAIAANVKNVVDGIASQDDSDGLFVNWKTFEFVGADKESDEGVVKYDSKSNLTDAIEGKRNELQEAFVKAFVAKEKASYEADGGSEGFVTSVKEFLSRHKDGVTTKAYWLGEEGNRKDAYIHCAAWGTTTLLGIEAVRFYQETGKDPVRFAKEFADFIKKDVTKIYNALMGNEDRAGGMTRTQGALRAALVTAVLAAPALKHGGEYAVAGAKAGYNKVFKKDED